MAGWSGTPSSTSTGSGGHGGRSTDPARAAYFAARHKVVERAMKHYAAGLCGLIAIFVLWRWVRWLSVKVERKRKPAGALGKPFVAVSRLLRNLLVRRVPGFGSGGHALVVIAYVAINLAIAFTNVQWTVSYVAHRFGWLSLANMVLVILLALKNTPLAFLTAYSYERLNCLHQIAGYTMFSQMVIHAAMYTSYFNSQGRLLSIYSQRGTIAGIVCGFGFLSVIFSAVFLRRVWYEIFYVVHVASWVVSVIAVGFHQPSIADKTLIVTLIAAVAWILDRIIRACRVLYYSANNEATLHPLPGGGTKIMLKKAPARAEPGKHCFVWIPAIRKFETHPFTIHRSDPVEFTVKARDGFTSDLHKYAAANPGVAVKASVDGPYGTFPDPMEFDKIVLIAGGGGATFTFGLAVNVLERMGEEDKKQIVFIWAVREHENLFWFREQLDMLLTQAQTPRVNVSLYVTRASSDISGTQEAQNSGERSSTDSPALSPIETDLEKSISHQRWARTTTTTTTTTATESDTEKDIEKTIETRVEHSKETATAVTATTKAAQTLLDYPVQLGRPDTAALIRDAVNITPSNQRVLVAACGPDGLMRVVRDTTARLIRGDGPAVEVHCEQFGW